MSYTPTLEYPEAEGGTPDPGRRLAARAEVPCPFINLAPVYISLVEVGCRQLAVHMASQPKLTLP